MEDKKSHTPNREDIFEIRTSMSIIIHIAANKNATNELLSQMRKALKFIITTFTHIFIKSLIINVIQHLFCCFVCQLL